jgi:peptide/nickel transport system substrate-binding protein
MTILQQDLKPLGINITVKTFVRAVQFQQEGIKPGKMDISDEGWLMDFPDPYDFINVLLNGEHIPATNGVNFSYFNVPKYNQAMDKAATLVGQPRYTAYGQLATQIFRDDPPWAAFGNRNNTDLFSARVGCTVYQPVYGMDYATMCIRK